MIQEVFHDAALAWDILGNSDLDRQRAWLFTVTKNKSISRWKANTRVEVGINLDFLPSGCDDTHDKALNSIALERCWDVLREMPLARYRVAYLRWHEQWSTREIAELFGIEQSTVRVHLKDARDLLVRAVGPDVLLATDPEAQGEGKEKGAAS
ncbi:MAG: RNA polymerase sigma factor [Pseudonocardiales bacterium]